MQKRLEHPDQLVKNANLQLVKGAIKAKTDEFVKWMTENPVEVDNETVLLEYFSYFAETFFRYKNLVNMLLV